MPKPASIKANQAMLPHWLGTIYALSSMLRVVKAKAAGLKMCF